MPTEDAYRTASRSSANPRRCRPSASKFAGSSQAAKPARTRGHSALEIEYHAVSRERPFTTTKHAMFGLALALTRRALERGGGRGA